VQDKGGEAFGKVTVEDGLLTLPCDWTDNAPILRSKGIPIEKGDTLIVQRRIFSHAGNTTYRPWTMFSEEVDNSWNLDLDRSYNNLFYLQHLNFTYDRGRYPENLTKGNLGFYRPTGVTKINEIPSEHYGISESTLERWIDEEFIYDTTTGQVTITSDGNTMTFMSKPLEYSHIRFNMNPYGWHTGHYDKLDWIDFKVLSSGSSADTPSNDPVLPQGQGTLTGTVKDAENSTPMVGAKAMLFQNGQAIESIATDATGSYSFTAPAGIYSIVIGQVGYLDVEYNQIENIIDETTYIETMMQVPSKNSDLLGTSTGLIRNAITGQIESGVTIEVREGLGNVSSSVIASVSTDDSGTYSYENAKPGNYTFTAIKNDFVSKSFSATVLGGEKRREPDVAITPVLTADQVRIVLRWGEHPRDLDTHFTGPSSEGEPFHIFYQNPRYINDVTSVILDVDNTSSYGPETVTLTKQTSGEYLYSVHDYTNAGSRDSIALSNSQATVEVYVGNNAPKTFNVPNQKGTLWKVFKMVDGQIQPLNNMMNNGD